MESSIHEATQVVVSLLVTYGLDILGAVVILILGWWIAGRIRAFVQKALGRIGFDPTLRVFLSSIARYVVLIVTVLAVLSQFGVETTSLIAVLGAAGLAIGLALQGTLSNVAAGVMLMIFRPFKLGDFIEAAGHSGTVKAINLFVTELATPDNVQIVLPNAQVWGSALKNFSHHSTRRVDLVMGISYDDDIDAAMTVVNETIAADDRVHGDPEPMVAVTNLGDSSVDLVIRIWCDAGDYWPLKFDMTKGLKQAFDAKGVGIPFPTRTVYNIAAGGSG